MNRSRMVLLLVLGMLAALVPVTAAPSLASSSDVVINEIIQNPDAVFDSAGEWFEVSNTTSDPIDIDGWTIADDDTDSHVIDNSGPLVIPAGGYLVLGNNADPTTNGGVTVDYEYSGIALANGVDELLLIDTAATEVDRVVWDDGTTFPDPTGASMALASPALDNSVGANWCEATTPFGDGDFGTPGAANDCSAPPAPTSALVLSGVVDGPLTGGIPKAIEVKVLGDVADLSTYGIGSANNGGGTDGQEFTFPSESASAGDVLYIATEETAFTSFFGCPPDYTDSVASINGDDAIELFLNGSVVDVFGDINIDGSGQPWEYLDGWASRNDATGPDGETFVIANWTFSGPNALDGETTNDTAATPFDYDGTCTPPPSSELVLSGVVDGPLPGGLPKAIEITVLDDVADLSLYGIGAANNGGGTDGQEFTFPSDSASAGDVLYIATEETQFAAFFGCPPDFTSSAASINGDDAIELFKDGSVVDVFGDINTDGSGQPWEYLDGWASRNDATGPDGETFVIANWTFSGPNALDGETSNTTATTPFDYDGTCTPPPDPAVVKIHDVQGSGSTSPLVGTLVEIQGVVVGDFQASDELEGFFVQEEDADIDTMSETSEGVFVYSTIPVEVGDLVTVVGTVAEFFGDTQISGTPVVTVDAGGVTLPSRAVISLPVSTLDDLEKIEGMAVEVANLTVTETFNLARFGEVVLGGERLPNPTQVAAPGAAANAQAAANQLNRIVLDDGSTLQNPPVVPYVTGGTLRGGQSVDAVGVLNYSFGEYRIQPTQEPVITGAGRPDGPPAVGGAIQIATFNVLNYFTTIDDSGPICGPLGDQGCRGADSASELDRQRDKIVAALVELDADVVGLMEIENNGTDSSSAIANLVAAVNAAGAGPYDWIKPASNFVGGDAIAVGLIYKPAVVTPLNGALVFDSSVDPTFNDDKNRAVLTQSFSDSAGAVFTVAVNHLKSKGSPCDDLGDPDAGDGQGNCNQTRTAAANALASWLATDPTGSGSEDAFIIGDLNAYAMEDPIAALEAYGYVNTLSASDYSYVFRGEWGTLDYVMASPSAHAHLTGAGAWHINADEPRTLDYNTEFGQEGNGLYVDDEFRSSDHDPIVVGYSPDQAPPEIDASIDAIYANSRAGKFVVDFTCTDVLDASPTCDATLNGIPVTDDQTVILIKSKRLDWSRTIRGKLYVVGSEFELVVQSTDVSGNFASTTVEAEFPPPWWRRWS